MKRNTMRHQAGDTIVEVLIAIAIVSMVLVGAFYVANNSTKTVQDNQEHTEAQQQLQTEVERLRAYLQTVPTNTTINAGVKYCMGSDQMPYPEANIACVAKPIGGTTAKPTFVRANNVYTFTISWDSINGGTASETFTYRAYPSGG